MKLGLVTYNLANDWDLDLLEARCEESGFRGVELRTSHAHGIEVELGDDARRELKVRLADSWLEIVGLGSVFEYDSADPRVLQKNIDGTKEYVRLAHDLGVVGIKVRPNRLHEEEGVEREKTLVQIGHSFNECAEFAADLGVEIRMEVHGKETCEPMNMRTIMENAPHENARVCWNSNRTDIVDGSIDSSFALLGDRIGMVHITELWNDYPWQRLFTLLKESGYSGYCLAEIPASGDPVRLMRYYRALWMAFGGVG
ncbi:MAG: sugar phosphate isomerase/epimerase [Candidatus Latescibacterota bacterium]